MYTVIVFGLAMYVFGVTAFLIPVKITAGGVTGISQLIFYATGIPAGYPYFIINSFLIILAIRILGTSFGLKTLFSMVIISLLLNIFPMFIKEPLVNDLFLSSVLGGILCGVGLGITFNQGGSTGGTDIIAMIINKYRNISPGRIIMYCDVIIITSSVFRETAVMTDFLLRRGLRPVIVLIDPASFGGVVSSEDLVLQIKAIGVPVRRVACGQDIATALSVES